MTFEERLDRIAERHEALAQTVEILGHDLHELTELVTRVERHNENLQRQTEILQSFAINHAQRIQGLEGDR